MDYDDKERIKTLLNYWVEHNKEHGREITEWAGKVRALGEDETCERMLEAVREMDKADELLAQALEKLR
jgi:nickel/cobalt exporter